MQDTLHYTQCPVCQSQQLQTVFSVKDYTVSGENFNILECTNCSLRFTQDVPNAATIGAYYKSENYISHSNTRQGLISQLYHAVRSHTLKQKAALVKRTTGVSTGSLLDLGCGTGSFLHTMALQNWAVTGLEPDADARKIAEQVFRIVPKPTEALFQLEEQSFDAITLWHVLEHVHSLQETISQLKLLLKKSGKLFIAVPNYTSRDAQTYLQYWAAYDVPRHLYHFSPQAMEILVQQHGLKIVKKLPMWFDSFYVSMLSSKYKNGSTHYLSSALQGLLSNFRAFGNVNLCSSVIYVLEKQ